MRSLAGTRHTLLLVLCASFVIPSTLFAVTSTMGKTSVFAGDGPENGNLLLAQDATPWERDNTGGGNYSGRSDDDVESGTNAVGGIPNRTTIYQTLSPRGGSLDDTAAIQSALRTCPPGQVVKLNPGTFNINRSGLSIKTSNCTLRGSGSGEHWDRAMEAPDYQSRSRHKSELRCSLCRE